jgi:hypothetical protein
MGFIFKDADEKPVDPKTARLRAILLSVPPALFGLLALVLLAHDGLHGGLDRQHAIGLLSAAIVCVGLIALIFGISAKKQALQAAGAKIPGEKPWLARKEWADGRIATSSRRAVSLLWVIVVFWCLASALILLAVVPPQLQHGSRAGFIVLIFLVIGLAIVIFALKTSVVWRAFNRAVFKMAALPAPAGGAITGEIQVPTSLRPQHGVHLRLSCVRRTTAGATNNRQTSEKVLWQDEKWLRADFPSANQAATSIPVFFKLADNLPDSAPAAGDGIQWKLEAYAKLSGPDFQAAFDVPVFKLPEPPAPLDDPTAPYQMSLDEIHQQIRSLVRVKELGDGGWEFMFPAARNPSFALGASMICLIWTGVLVVLLFTRAPLLFLLVLTAIDLLMIAFVLDLWFRRSHVTVTPGGLKVQRAWFVFKKEQSFPTAEIRGIASEVGAMAGHAAFYDLKVRTRDGREFMLAKHLDNKPEADWLVRQMIGALRTRSNEGV